MPNIVELLLDGVYHAGVVSASWVPLILKGTKCLIYKVSILLKSSQTVSKPGPKQHHYSSMRVLASDRVTASATTDTSGQQKTKNPYQYLSFDEC